MTDSSEENEAKGNSPVTLRAIARRVGYSHVTVARALADEQGVGPRTRDRIREAAREMGYRPNPVMSRMMRQIRDSAEKREAETIAVIEHEPGPDGKPVFQRLSRGIEEQANLMGYATNAFTVGPGGLSPARLRDVLEARGIRGFLALAFQPSELEGESFRSFLRVKLPLPSENPEMVYIARNSHATYQKIYGRLRELGYRRVGFAKRACITGAEESTIIGCLETIALRPPREAEPGFQPLFVYDEDAPDTAERMRAWVEENRLEAVVGGNAAYPFLRELGYRIPEELGFACSNVAPGMPYAGASLPLPAIGRASVRVLNNLLTANLYGRPEDTEVVLIPSEWTEGSTLLPRARMTR